MAGYRYACACQWEVCRRRCWLVGMESRPEGQGREGRKGERRGEKGIAEIKNDREKRE